MATRTITGWTPGSPIDGQVLHLFKGTGGVYAPAGSYPMANNATSVEVDGIESGFMYKAVLRSTFETEESNDYLELEFTSSGERGSESGSGGGNESIPGPTGSLALE